MTSVLDASSQKTKKKKIHFHIFGNVTANSSGKKS